jgi:hypothetical protein
VRIAHSNFIESKEQFELNERIYQAYKKHLETSKKNAGSLGKISPLEIARLELETAERAIERTRTLGIYYLSFYRLLNSIGVEALEEEKIASAMESLKKYSIKLAEEPGLTESEKKKVSEDEKLLNSIAPVLKEEN